MSAQIRPNEGEDFEPRLVGGSAAAEPEQEEAPRSFWDIQITKQKVKLLDIALFASQWQAMESAGIPTVSTIGLLAGANRKSSPRLAEALDDVRENVEDGMTLGKAFKLHEDIFGELTCEMIATGEDTGTLERHLGDIAEDCEYRHQNKSTLLAALFEPALIVVTGIGVSWVLMKYSIPQFAQLFEALTRDGTLPLPTQILISVSDFLNSWLGIFVQLALVGAVVSFFTALKRSREFRYTVHKHMLKIPVFGELALLEAVARGAKTLAIVQKSVGRMSMGLELASKTTPNLFVGEAFADVNEAVYEGSTVWEAMQNTGVFPELAIYMARSGEETGKFDTMLEKLAETYERRVKYVREQMTVILRYSLLLIMGVFVIAIMLAMYMPTFTLIDRMSR